MNYTPAKLSRISADLRYAMAIFFIPTRYQVSYRGQPRRVTLAPIFRKILITFQVYHILKI